MALKLQLNSTIIPIEIGEFKFEVDMTGDKQKALKKEMEELASTVKQLDVDSDEDQEKLEEMLKEQFDKILGSGAYDKLHGYTPNATILAGVYENMLIGISKEMQKKINSPSASKVMQKKANSTKNKPGAKK